MLAAVAHDGPVVYLEHKLLSDYWLDYLGGTRRANVAFGVPARGAEGEVDEPLRPVPLGSAAVRRHGTDLAFVSVGVGVHRCLEAANILAADGLDAAVIDLRSVAPLDRAAIVAAGASTKHVIAVDEDYLRGGVSGEIAAILSEEGVGAAFPASPPKAPFPTPAKPRTEHCPLSPASSRPSRGMSR